MHRKDAYMTTRAVQNNVTVGIFRSHADAEAAITQLQQAGFHMKTQH